LSLQRTLHNKEGEEREGGPKFHGKKKNLSFILLGGGIYIEG